MGVYAGKDGDHTVEIEVLAKQPDRSVVKNDDTRTAKYDGTHFQPSQILVIGEILETDERE